jgi:hypothetical protein
VFLRRYERRSGKRKRKRTYWALVESVRTQSGSRQRLVAYLGELGRSEQTGWAQLGRSLSGRERPSRSLFHPPHYDDPSDDEPVPVNVRDVRLERLRDFGDVWMAWGLGRLLGLDTLLEGLAASGREAVPWPTVAAILTIARLCEPSSELHVETTWYRRTALEDLLGVSVEKVHTDRLYDGLDWLLPHKAAIEKHLKERLGRLMSRYWRAARAFEVQIERLSPPQGKVRRKVTWTRNQRWSDWAAVSAGCCLLRTNLPETDPAVLWERYIQLTEAAWAFRITKDELEIRPIWRQKEKRVLGHILICFLAYVLWKTLGQWMRRAGLGDGPRTVLEELAKIKSGDVVLPTRTKQGRDNGTIRLRCVTEPDEAQKVLLHRLGVTLPQRLRRIDEIVPM